MTKKLSLFFFLLTLWSTLSIQSSSAYTSIADIKRNLNSSEVKTYAIHAAFFGLSLLLGHLFISVKKK